MAQTFDLNGNDLIVTSGGIMRVSTTASALTIQGTSGGTLTSGIGELFFVVNDASALTVSVPIVDNTAGSVALVRSGAGCRRPDLERRQLL